MATSQSRFEVIGRTPCITISDRQYLSSFSEILVIHHWNFVAVSVKKNLKVFSLKKKFCEAWWIHNCDRLWTRDIGPFYGQLPLDKISTKRLSKKYYVYRCRIHQSLTVHRLWSVMKGRACWWCIRNQICGFDLFYVFRCSASKDHSKNNLRN
jgi:hypothetical protein